jgi:segregation and condensation protein A
MSYEIRTPVFEGPLDLLLQLITAHQVEITAVSLTDLVGEYLAYLDLMADLDLEITSEFLVIAATLIQLKARHLLPDDAEIDLDEDLTLSEERDRLLSRLLACLTFKDVAAVLAHRLETTSQLMGRFAGLDPDVRPRPPEVRLSATPEELAGLASRMLERRREPDLDHLDLDLPSVAAAISEVRFLLAGEIETDFDRIVADANRPREVVAYFLAVLELARWGLIQARQEDSRATILLRHLKNPDGDLISEWQT